MLELYEIRAFLEERGFTPFFNSFEAEESREFVVGRRQVNIEPLYDTGQEGYRPQLDNWFVFRLTEKPMREGHVWDDTQLKYVETLIINDRFEERVRYFKVLHELMYAQGDSWEVIREPVLLSQEDAEKFILSEKEKDEQFARIFSEGMSTDEGGNWGKISGE